MDPLVVAFLGPGQFRSANADLDTLMEEPSLAGIMPRLDHANKAILGENLTDRLNTATPQELHQDTRLDQSKAYIDAASLFFGLIYYQPKGNGQRLIDRMAAGELSWVYSGDSIGTMIVQYLPHANETERSQMAKYADGLAAIDQRGIEMHLANEQYLKKNAVHIQRDGPGGMHIYMFPNRRAAGRALKTANAQSRRGPRAALVKFNSTGNGDRGGLYGIAASDTQHEYIQEHLREFNGRHATRRSGIIPVRYHDKQVMESAARAFTVYLSDNMIHHSPYPYVSNRTGKVRTRYIASDLGDTIKEPIRFYTQQGKSVVATVEGMITPVDDKRFSVVVNSEVASWLRDSKLEPLLITDLTSLHAAYQTIDHAVRQVQPQRAGAMRPRYASGL